MMPAWCAAAVVIAEAKHLEREDLEMLQQVAGPESSFVSTDPGSDFKNQRADAVVLGPDQGRQHVIKQNGQFSGRGIFLFGGQFTQFWVRFFRQHLLGLLFLDFELLVFRITKRGGFQSSTTPGQIGHTLMVGEDFGIAHGFTQSMPFLGNPSKVGEMAFRIVQDASSMAGNETRRGMAAA